MSAWRSQECSFRRWMLVYRFSQSGQPYSHPGQVRSRWSVWSCSVTSGSPQREQEAGCGRLEDADEPESDGAFTIVAVVVTAGDGNRVTPAVEADTRR